MNRIYMKNIKLYIKYKYILPLNSLTSNHIVLGFKWDIAFFISIHSWEWVDGHSTQSRIDLYRNILT